MRKNPYNKNLKDQIPLLMQGPSMISALTVGARSAFEGIVEIKKKEYIIEDMFDPITFTMVKPPFCSKNGVITPEAVFGVEMGQTEVTQQLFKVIMGWNDSFNLADVRNPVDQVSWFHCIDFCNKLSMFLGKEPCYTVKNIKLTGKKIRSASVSWDENANGFRLPTIKEWRAFAACGTKNFWSGCNDIANLDKYAWFHEYTNKRHETHPVGQKLPNEWGLYDMSGNVSEWVWDAAVTMGGQVGLITNRSSLGGSFGDQERQCGINANKVWNADRIDPNCGFRICRTSKF